MSWHIFPVLLCAFVMSVLVVTSPASAGTYDVNICRSNTTGSLPGWSHSETAGTSGGLPYWYQSQNCSGYGVYRRFQINPLPNGAVNDWTFTAPANTSVASFYHDGTATPTGAGAYDAIFAYSPTGKQSVAIASSGLTWNGQPTSSTIGSRLFPMPPNTSQVQLEVGCAASSCPGTDASGSYANTWMWAGGYVRLSDDFNPVVDNVTGSGWEPAPVDGQDSVEYQVSDRGAGVRNVRLLVDGIERAVHPGNCEPIGVALVPCSLTASGTFTLDTTQLSEGPHVVAVTAEDASGNAASAAEQTKTIMVRRKPALVLGDNGTDRPTISGAGEPFTVGELASGNKGTWSGAGISYSYEWKRCDGTGEACTSIGGAQGADYTAAGSDVGHKLIFCVTASNTGGSASRCSLPTAAVQADTDRDNIPDARDGCPSVAAATSDGCPAMATVADMPSHVSAQAMTNTGRGTANGVNASDGAKLLALISGRASTMRVGYGKRATVIGRLATPTGQVISGARLTVHQKLNAAGASFRTVGTVTTSADGRFRYVVSAGPSRTIRFTYRAFEHDKSVASTTDVLLRVKGALTLKAPKMVRNRSKALFSGVVKGRPIPSRGVLVDLQVFFRKQWRTFATPRTNARGIYKFRYRFTQGAAKWKFRARNRHDSAHPYELAYSRRVTVRVIR